MSNSPPGRCWGVVVGVTVVCADPCSEIVLGGSLFQQLSQIF